MSEGLQIQRYGAHAYSCEKDMKGQYCLFSDAEQFHSAAQEALGKNMILSAENKTLRSNLDSDRKCIEEQREAAEKDKVVRDQLVEALKGAQPFIDFVRRMACVDGIIQTIEEANAWEIKVNEALKAAGEEV